MRGSYIMLKINLLISMWLLQPLYTLFVALMTRVGGYGGICWEAWVLWRINESLLISLHAAAADGGTVACSRLRRAGPHCCIRRGLTSESLFRCCHVRPLPPGFHPAAGRAALCARSAQGAGQRRGGRPSGQGALPPHRPRRRFRPCPLSLPLVILLPDLTCCLPVLMVHDSPFCCVSL
jgi:hypothetical protein